MLPTYQELVATSYLTNLDDARASEDVEVATL